MVDYISRKSQILLSLGKIQISITSLNFQQIQKKQYFSSITEKTSSCHMNNGNTLSHYGKMMIGGFFLKMQEECSSNTQVQSMHCAVISLLISRSSFRVQNKHTCKFLVLQSYHPIIELLRQPLENGPGQCRGLRYLENCPWTQHRLSNLSVQDGSLFHASD